MAIPIDYQNNYATLLSGGFRRPLTILFSPSEGSRSMNFGVKPPITQALNVYGRFRDIQTDGHTLVHYRTPLNRRAHKNQDGGCTGISYYQIKISATTLHRKKSVINLSSIFIPTIYPLWLASTWRYIPKLHIGHLSFT